MDIETANSNTFIMQAVRIQSHLAPPSSPYSASNPAPSSALVLDHDIPIPQPLRPGELLIRVKAASVIRDTLSWPEMYEKPSAIPGHDFSGIVVSVHPDVEAQSEFRAGDEVFGMVNADRGGTWATYAIVLTPEVAKKPQRLSWAAAASVPLSALTAYQALFRRAGLEPPLLTTANPASNRASQTLAPRVLVTGASGGVGVQLLQMARLAGCYVVAATSSKERNEAKLKALGADEVVEYATLHSHGHRYNSIIDTVGGDVLIQCWSLAAENGSLISVHTSSYNFVEEHRGAGIARDTVQAKFFIVEPSNEDLTFIARALELDLLKSFVASALPVEEAAKAYDLCQRGGTSQDGKTVLIM